jgi:hypothetical protein
MSNAKPRPNIRLEIGPDRRVGDRRKEDLGGPIVEPIKLLYTREEAIGQILEQYLGYFCDMDDADRINIIMNGWYEKPLKKFTNRELQNRLRDDEEDERIKVRG